MSHPVPNAIGKYRIIKEIGRGASSTVYLGEDEFNQRHVAIKQIHAHLLKDPATSENYRRALLHEAKIAGRLRHPHVVRLLDVDGDATPPYLVLEYVTGRSLSAYVTPDQLLPISQVLDIVYKCCSALDHAHLRGLVHRDVKPANVMLQLDGTVKVADFGTAFSTTGDVTTQAKGLAGSPLYIAPELIRGEAPTLKSDMFSLGVTLYELLTGRQPFAADTEFAVLYKIGNEEPPAPSTLRPELPEALDRLIARAMAKRPEDRPAEWPEFADALLAISRDLPAAASKDRESERYVQMRFLPFFTGFTDAALWETLRLGRVREFAAGATLMQEDTKGESFLVLLAGRVAVQRQGVHLMTLDSGTTLGEMCYLQPDNPIRSATAIAETKGVAVEIRSDALRRASNDLQMLFDKAFIHLMVTRLIAANKKLAVWAGLDVFLGDAT
jgi:tRNA A-37 threonylcarbamoyl transferase component Bud32/CRP-like cAMP-binding protein